MAKRKTYQTLWELESIYIRACRVAGINPDIESYKDLDNNCLLYTSPSPRDT